MAPQFPPTARHHGLPRRRQRCLIRASTIQRRIALPQPPAHARRPSPHPRLTSESRSAMTATATSPTRNTSGEKRRTSCSSAQSPTASRYGRNFGARSPPGPTSAAATPASPTIPIRQFAWLAGRPRALIVSVKIKRLKIGEILHSAVPPHEGKAGVANLDRLGGSHRKRVHEILGHRIMGSYYYARYPPLCQPQNPIITLSIQTIIQPTSSSRKESDVQGDV